MRTMSVSSDSKINEWENSHHRYSLLEGDLLMYPSLFESTIGDASLSDHSFTAADINTGSTSVTANACFHFIRFTIIDTLLRT